MQPKAPEQSAPVDFKLLLARSSGDFIWVRMQLRDTKVQGEWTDCGQLCMRRHEYERFIKSWSGGAMEPYESDVFMRFGDYGIVIEDRRDR